MGDGQGVERPLFQKPVKHFREIGRRLDVALEATPKGAAPDRLPESPAARRDPHAPAREPALEVRYHGAVRTGHETYHLTDGAHLAGCNAQPLGDRTNAVRSSV